MQANNDIEIVYDLLEKFDFTELSEFDKHIVLSVMQETEYTEMRKSIVAVKDVLHDDIEPMRNASQNAYIKETMISRVINFRIKLYQVAASVAILISGYILFQPSNENITNQEIASNTKTVIRNIDTIETIIYDTVVIIKEKVEYIQAINSEQEKIDNPPLETNKTDCSKMLCVNELENIALMNSRNNITNDTTLKGILLSLY